MFNTTSVPVKNMSDLHSDFPTEYRSLVLNFICSLSGDFHHRVHVIRVLEAVPETDKKEQQDIPVKGNKLAFSVFLCSFLFSMN